MSDDSPGETPVQYQPGPAGGIEAELLPVNLQSDYAGPGLDYLSSTEPGY